ncbi:MAG: MFS transporter [Rhizobiales bacterium]|nr:MFS transporter [Hyphomicrobiales bacterium]
MAARRGASPRPSVLPHEYQPVHDCGAAALRLPHLDLLRRIFPVRRGVGAVLSGLAAGAGADRGPDRQRDRAAGGGARIADALWGLALPVGEALALTGVRRFGLDYGRMRIGGSVAYIIANLGSGALLGIFHVEALFWFLIVAMGSSALVSATLPVTPKEVRALDDASRPPPPRAREILGHPGFFALVIAGGLIQASHAMLYGFGSIHWHGLGFSGLEIGIFWSTGVVCEITLFMVSTRAVRIAGPLGLVTLGGFVAILRWGLFATDPGFAGVMALMALHAFTFGATYAGNQHAIARLVPEEMTASAQAIYGSTSAILMAGATALAGPLYEAFGAHAFLAMIVPAAIGLAIIAALVRFSPRGRALRA